MQWIWKGYMFAGAMQRMLSEGYSLRLLQEARQSKTQILVSETCRRCFSSQQYIWFWTLSSNFLLCLHLILTSVSVIWPQVVRRDRFLLVTQTLISKSYSMTTCLDFKGTFSDFEITYYVIVLLVDKKNPNKQQWVNCSIFYCLNCFPLHLVWTIWIGSLTKCCPCSS